jgi:Fe-S-cluster containining protein
MKNGKAFPVPVKVKVSYSCKKCPGFCCTYSDIEITQRDIARLGKHFGLSPAVAETRFTKADDTGKARLLRHRADKHFTTACMFLDQEKRRCTVYEARPGVCRQYPDSTKCGYYDFLRFERVQQGDPEFIATTA